ncbi:hypothetical protein N7450_006008 [Penicillium hetheringtonii]|uniref:Uncharacterized protein n=1 Tax=Penicillium hetheringtonii TaxID=911720 RepID=A0AAD6GTL4_9EURO|nr:hypothetical protein N7450_006008 [Penicillium hetheringtonii]
MGNLSQSDLKPTDLERLNSHIKNLTSVNSYLKASRHLSPSHHRATIPRFTTMSSIDALASGIQGNFSIDPISQSTGNTPIETTLDSRTPILTSSDARLGILKGTATPPNIFDMMFFDASPADGECSQASSQGDRSFLTRWRETLTDFALERFMIQQQLVAGIHPKDVLPMMRNKPPDYMNQQPMRTIVTTENGLARHGPDRPRYIGKLRRLPKHIRDSLRSQFQASSEEQAEVARFYSESYRNLSGLATAPGSLQDSSDTLQGSDVTMVDPDETELEGDNESEDLGSLFEGEVGGREGSGQS